MAENKYIEQKFPIKCFGRDSNGKNVLNEPVSFDLLVRQAPYDENIIEIEVWKCPYNTGGHGQRCKASHPNQDKVGEGVTCCYAIDLPWATDQYSGLIRNLKSKGIDVDKHYPDL